MTEEKQEMIYEMEDSVKSFVRYINEESEDNKRFKQCTETVLAEVISTKSIEIIVFKRESIPIILIHRRFGRQIKNCPENAGSICSGEKMSLDQHPVFPTML
jgi:hypothetical protein